MHYIKSDELMHYGIMGMKWGVRRYQNADGTLTAAGKARYLSSTDSDRTYKDMKKAVRNKRAIEKGKANRWMSGTPIGENSKKLFAENDQKRRKYYDSKEYQDWYKKATAADKKNSELFESGKISIQEYDKRWDNLMKERPKKNFNDAAEGGYVLTSSGRKYINNFHKKGGFDVSVAYLQDLGFNADEAKQLTRKMLKNNHTLGMD